ncbi:putative uncharacterized protein DDB_G0274435 isoform X1 [Amphiprion ocellaris]|uniref:putative uncharacterized protein DDB_G0274435 isoform X1 n=1 Tax=Amphiprion ocellaris TaxID=80972 RepID=UPI0024113017|nr:putative uncharacterized protein DDB_G0274435 isoform X1 [Amphiprion ocellaris]
MSSVQNLRELINQRLTAAAEEIFTEFEKTIVQYEEEIDRQRRLLDNIWKPQITQHTADLPNQHVCEEKEVVTEQNVCNQERNSSLDQENPKPPQIKEEEEELCTNLDQEEPKPPQMKEEEEELCTNLDQEEPKPPQMKEEQEELCTNLDGQQLVPNQDTYTYMLVQCKSKCKDLSGEIYRVFEKVIVHYEEELSRQRKLLDITWKLEIPSQTTGLPQQHVCKEYEVFTDQQLCNQKRNSSLDHDNQEPPLIKNEQEELYTSLDQEDLEPPKIKEEQEEFCTNREGEQLGVKQETDTFMVTVTYEESDHSEPETNSDQLLSYNYPVAESQIRKEASRQTQD